MTTLEKLQKLDDVLDKVRAEVAGLGIMSALIRDIKGDLESEDSKRIAFVEWMGNQGWEFYAQYDNVETLWKHKYTDQIQQTSELLTMFNNKDK